MAERGLGGGGLEEEMQKCFCLARNMDDHAPKC